MLREQPAELTYHVLVFLPAEDLARLGACARYLKYMTDDENLWKELCRLKYRTVKHHPFTLHPAGVYSTPTILSHLTAQDCKDILSRRGVNQRRWNVFCLQTRKPKLIGWEYEESSGGYDEEREREKMEERELEREYENELEELKQMVIDSEGEEWPVPEAMIGVEYGGKWKCSYIATLLDLPRSKITSVELTAYPWSYSTSWAYNDQEEARVKFYNNGYRYGDGGWPRKQSWEINRRGRVQVANFPTHESERDSRTGGWTFSNAYVTYKSICTEWEQLGIKDEPAAGSMRTRVWDWD